MNIIKSYGKLSGELRKYFLETYEDGFEGALKVIHLGGKGFYVVPFEHKGDHYLIKISATDVEEEDIDLSTLSTEADVEESVD